MEDEQDDLTIHQVVVPTAGESVHQCQVANWHVEDGQHVELGDTLVTLETDKVSTELESEFIGKITRLFTSRTTVNIGDTIAKIASTAEDLKNMEEKKNEQPPPKPNKEKQDSSLALFKLIALVLLAFVVVKYGKPLMEQISAKSSEMLDKKTENTDEAKEVASIDVEELPSSKPESSARISKGYEAWEPAVREQLEEWHADVLDNRGKYKLTNIDVNDAQNTMEIRYRLIEVGDITSKRKVILKKDGFGNRFIYSDGNKEFLVYPPE